MLNNKLFSLVKKIIPSEMVFWTGAGISIQSPTTLPSGAYLTKLMIDTFMPKETFNLIKDLFLSGEFKDSFGRKKTLPRLELIIEDIVNVLGFQAFDYFSFMDIPEQYLNSYHLFFAKHVNEGGIHFTMNLDNGIEKAGLATTKVISYSNQLNNELNKLDAKLLKLHGTMNNSDSYKDLGLVLKNITSGFKDILAQYILKVLTNKQILCFIGYGGIDSFDVTPFFNYFIGTIPGKKLEHLKVIWVSHKKQDIFESCELDDIGNGGPAILNGLKKAGAEIYSFKGNTTEFLSYLINIWGWNLKKVKLENLYNWENIFYQKVRNNSISEAVKNLIVSQYMSALGVGYRAVSFCNLPNTFATLNNVKEPEKGVFTSQTNQWWRVYTNGLRDLGRYKEAIKKIKEWKQKVRSPFDIFVVLSRLMGEYRIRGNFLKAFLTYKKAKNILKKNNLTSTENPDELFAFSEFWLTYLYLHRDLWKKFSKVRGIVFYFWRDIISKAWTELFLLNRNMPLPHFSAQLYILAEQFFEQSKYFINQLKQKDPSIPQEIKECFKVIGITNFIETDSLIGDINYQREYIIDRNIKYSSVIAEIESNLLKAKIIQDWPGVWKAYYRLAKQYIYQRNFSMAYINAFEALIIIKKVEYSIFYRIDYTIRLLRILIMSKILIKK